MSYYTIWNGGANTIDIPESIINGPWRLRPDNGTNSTDLFVEYCSAGKYTAVQDSFSAAMPGTWQFVISDFNTGNDNRLTINHTVQGAVQNYDDGMETVVEWRFCYGCNHILILQSVRMDDSVQDHATFEPAVPVSTSLSDLLTCLFYSEVINLITYVKPVELYLESLCCLKEHYKVTKTYLESQKLANSGSVCGGTLTEYCRCRAISEICCALELLGNLEAQLHIDRDNNATQQSQGTQDAVLDFFTYLVSAKGLVVLNSDLERITSLDNAGCFSTYGVMRYSRNCCRKMPFYLKPCYVFGEQNT